MCVYITPIGICIHHTPTVPFISTSSPLEVHGLEEDVDAAGRLWAAGQACAAPVMFVVCWFIKFMNHISICNSYKYTSTIDHRYGSYRLAYKYKLYMLIKDYSAIVERYILYQVYSGI